MSARPLLIPFALFASSALAAPTIDPQFGTHAVIQRGREIDLTGSASANERLVVNFAGEEKTVTADSKGRWKASFDPHAAGGPYKISVTGTGGSAASEDVVVGDLWLCSGQSNMEYPLRRALNGDAEVQNSSDDGLRVMKVPEQLAALPQPVFANPPQWQRAAPASMKDFSAVCTFLVRNLRATENIPIGAIDDTWGGTPIRAWMAKAAVSESGDFEGARLVDLYRRDPTAAVRQFGAEWGSWWRSRTRDKSGQEPWRESDRLAWKPVPSLTYWDSWGPEWKAWIGSAWFRKRVTITPAEAAEGATLSLSAIDDLDQTFVNGIPVGGRNDPANPRSYPLPKGVLKPGSNEIIVFARNVWGQGGLAGPAERFALVFADGHSRPLETGWQYSRIDDSVGQPPVSPWEGSSGISTIYNAMVAPLGALGIRGVAWYQGETDVGQIGYDRRLSALTSNWRAQFEDPDLPFLVVGLAGFGRPVSHPVESGWAAIINEQRLGVERDPRSALVSAIDLGEPGDIHPANKQEVGRRLALSAHRLVYGDGGTIGALPVSAVRQGDLVAVTFTKPLLILSGKSAASFELCGPLSGSCRYADARLAGTRIEITLDGQPATRVRYAWADYPIVNLYDLDLLPVPVFELDIQ